MLKKLYEGFGNAINQVSNITDVKDILGVIFKGDYTVSPFILLNDKRMNRKVSFGSANDILSAGSYRLGTSITDTPNDGSLAWLEVRSYYEGNTDEVHVLQTYIANDGTTQTRYFDGTSWSAWS